MTYYGVGGIGKTSLVKELRRHAKQLYEDEQIDVCMIHLDLDSDHIGAPADALYAFRTQWPGNCPLFEFALAKYWAVQGRTIEQIRKQIIREDSLLFDLIEAGATLADVFAPAKLVKKLYAKGSDFLRRHGHLAARFDHVESLTDAELDEWLPALLGEEIEQWVTSNNKRLLVFIDGHERLFASDRYKFGKASMDDRLQELVGTAGKGFYVICGHNRIEWADNNVEWKRYLEQHLLGALANADANAFLHSIPVTEDNLRETIVAASHGVPLYLDLCTSIYVIKKQAGESIRNEDFEGAGGRVIDRFLSYLDREHAETVRALSGIECFDSRVFFTVTKALNIGLPVTLYDEFCSTSYAEILHQPSRLAKIHDIVRAYLRPRINGDDYCRIVLAVVAEAQATKNEGDYPRVSWLMRALLPALGILRGTLRASTWSEIVVLCLELADAGYVEDAISVANDLSRSSNPKAISVLGDIIQAHCFRRTGRLKEARENYALIKTEMSAVSVPELRLRVQYNTAHVDHLLGHYLSAKREYESIVATQDQCPEDQDTRHLATRQLGDLLMLEGRFSEALRIFNACQNIRQMDKLWRLECRRFIGHVYRFNWMLPEAEKYYLEVAEQSKAYGLRGMYGKALVNLTETYWWMNPNGALEAGREAVEANEACGNLIEVGKAQTSMALAEINLGHRSNAIGYLDKAKKTQEIVGYRAGMVFVEGARACYWFAVGMDDVVSACLTKIQQETDVLGVYKYLSWFYQSVCAGKDLGGDSFGPYDWVDRSRMSDGIRLLSAKLRQIRSNGY